MITILRGVTASALFAVALLGLDAAPARAADPAFLPPTQIGGFDAGRNSAPAFADLDGDGDQDLVSGSYYGTFLYFENTGSASSATFTARTGAANPLDGFMPGYNVTPSFADLDDDGDMDLVAGAATGGFAYFENTGSDLSPTFVARTGTASPLNAFSVSGYAAPTFVDLDGDGDLDLISGDDFGALSYFENIGSASSAVFVARSGAASPVDGLGVGSYSAPALADLDEDGDLDLVVGEYGGAFAYFENTGSVSSATFTAQPGPANPLDGFDLGYLATPAFVDLDSDGDFDLVSGAYEGTFRFFENTTPITNPNFVEAIGAENPLDGYFTSGFSAPAFGDLDADGDLDVVSGGIYGTFLYYENTGLATAPAFTERMGIANPLDAFGVGYGGSTPVLADLDADGDLDMVSGSYVGGFFYFENTGSAAAPAFTERTGLANPVDGLGAAYISSPTLVDLDDDGDFDLVSGEGAYGGAFLYFENTGSANSPSFVQRTGAANPMDGILTGLVSKPTFVDADGDLDFDLVSGSFDGPFAYSENVGSASMPAFEQRVGALDPFRALDPGPFSSPVLADLNGDGGLDLLAGESSGTFVYYVPEPSGSLALAAGGWLLGLLARRGRRPRE